MLCLNLCTFLIFVFYFPSLARMNIDHTLFDFQNWDFFVVLDFGGEVLGETMGKFVHM